MNEQIASLHKHDPEAVIQTVNLTKWYGKHRGIENINLTLQPGEAYGFLGPNGAGKTTTIRCLLDLLRPTSGESFIFGQKVGGSSSYLRNSIGYVAGEVRLIPGYSGEDHIRMVEGLRKQKAPYAKSLIERFEIDPKRKVKTLSKGNKQKLALVMAFMFDNKLFILDEPTSGLDPHNQQLVFQMVHERRELGATILLSSHILSEVEESCSRVGIVSGGQLLAQENIKSLLERQHRKIKIRFAEEVKGTWKTQAELQHARWIDACTLKGDIHPQQLTKLLASLAHCSIADIEIQKPNLEEVFMEYYGMNQFDSPGVATRRKASRKERAAS